MLKGYANRVLEVDLAARTFSFKPLDEEIARLYIGGKGYGTRLLYDMTRPGIDALGRATGAAPKSIPSGVLLAVGTGAFWAGQANRTPLVEAALPHPAELTEPADVPFQDHEEEAAQLQTLNPEEMSALLKRLDTPSAPTR